MTLVGKAIQFATSLGNNFLDQVKQIPGQFVSDQYQKYWNNYYSRRQEAAQKRAEERQNAEWWKRYEAQLAYQSPAHQAQLIRQAGGNPLTLFAQGYSPNPANPVQPGLSSPSLTPYDAGASDLFKTVNPRVGNIDASTREMYQQTALGKAQEDLLRTQKLSVLQEMRIRSFEEKFQEAIQEDRLDKYRAEVDSAIKYIDNLDAETKKALAETDYYKQLKYQSIALEALYKFQVEGLGPAQVASLNASAFRDNQQANEIMKLLQVKYENLEESTKRLIDLSYFDDRRLDIDYDRLEVERALQELQEGKFTYQKIKNLGKGSLIVLGVALVASGVATHLGLALLGIGGVSSVGGAIFPK